VKEYKINNKDRAIIYGVALIFLIFVLKTNLPFYPHCFWVLPLYFILATTLATARRIIFNDRS